jgi:hypothetical protein
MWAQKRGNLHRTPTAAPLPSPGLSGGRCLSRNLLRGLYGTSKTNTSPLPSHPVSPLRLCCLSSNHDYRGYGAIFTFHRDYKYRRSWQQWSTPTKFRCHHMLIHLRHKKVIDHRCGNGFRFPNSTKTSFQPTSATTATTSTGGSAAHYTT